MKGIGDAPWIGNPDYGRKSCGRALVHTCEYCKTDIWEGDECVEYQGEIFCDRECMLESLSSDIKQVGDEVYTYADETFYSWEQLVAFIEEEVYVKIAEPIDDWE